MEIEPINIARILEARRHAVKESIDTISGAELQALAPGIFPYLDHPWLATFLEVAGDPASGVFHHAMADDHIHVLYCHNKNIGMWFIRGSGMGPLQPAELKIMREVVEAKP